MTVISHGNILAVFFAASESELQEGKVWYDTARKATESISGRYDGICPRTVAAVIAALSPNNRWHRNVRDAEALIAAHSIDPDGCDAIKVSTYSGNKAKALRILGGEYPLDVLGGNKVRAFYQCIAGDDGAVCVDGHAFSIWTGQRVPTTKTPKISDKLYNAISGDYRKAAEVINQVTLSCYSAAQVQAITWVTWRNLFKGESK